MNIAIFRKSIGGTYLLTFILNPAAILLSSVEANEWTIVIIKLLFLSEFLISLEELFDGTEFRLLTDSMILLYTFP
jgi:hypothetical protein